MPVSLCIGWLFLLLDEVQNVELSNLPIGEEAVDCILFVRVDLEYGCRLLLVSEALHCACSDS